MPTNPKGSPETQTPDSFTDVFDIPADKQPCYLVRTPDDTIEYADLADALASVRRAPDRKLYAAWELPKLLMYLQVGLHPARLMDPTVHALLTMVEGNLHPLYALYALAKAQTWNLASARKIAEEALMNRTVPTLQVLFDKAGFSKEPEDG